MNITLDKSSTVNATLTVAISEIDYKEKVSKTLKDYRKKASIKGFRPGMVPQDLINKMYSKPVLVEEINTILSEAVSDYIKENTLNIIGDPLPNREKSESINWDTDKEFSFSYELGLASDFSVDFAALPAIINYEIKIEQNVIDEALEQIKNQFATQIHPEEVAEGDMIFVSYDSNGKTEKTALPYKSLNAVGVKAFAGAKLNANVSAVIADIFVDDKSASLATGIKAEKISEHTQDVSFVVEDITRNQPAELNQELFDKAVGKDKVTTEQEFLEEVKSIIGDNYQREANYLLKLQAERTVIEGTKIELPLEFLRKWLVAINEGKFTESDIDADFDKVVNNTKWSLIKNDIAKTNNIKIDYPEVLIKAKEMVRSQFGMYAASEDDQMEEMITKIASNYLSDKSKSDNFSTLFNQVYDEKVAEVLLANLKSETKQVTVDEFKALAEAL
ncbi:MAG: trigger factor [Pseudarcicella sp.]|nr:trigger factor [Pseudarcicella sp.]MBP6410794.1 trigger factor [Pseudarcicella sp.]